MPTKKFVVIDGNAILHRAWHALPPTLMTEDGTIVNAVYGFASVLLKVLQELKPEYVAVAWDTAAPTFRKEKYEQYKATRKEKEQELYDQIPLIQNLVRDFGYPNVFLDGFEADDVIGTLAAKAQKKKDIETIIVTGDMDALQLINDRVKVYKLKKGIMDTSLMDAADVKTQYGLGPEQMIDYKALRGDTSDNIPGVKGIGEKTATLLLQQFGTLKDLYKAIDKKSEVEGIKPAQLKKLQSGKADAFLAQDLVTIHKAVPVDFSFEQAAATNFDVTRALLAFQKLGFKSLIARLPRQSAMVFDAASGEKKPAAKLGAYTHVTDPKETDRVAAELKKHKLFAFDTETTGSRVFDVDLLGLSVSHTEKKAYYIEASAITDKLKAVFADPDVKKVAHQAKFDLEMLQQNGFEVQGLIFDTKIAAYLLNPGQRNHGLKDQAFAEFGAQMTTLEDLLGTGKKKLDMTQLFAQKPKELAQYGAADSDFTLRLYNVLKPRLKKEHLEHVFNDIELPLISVLARMETYGVLVDTKALSGLSGELERSIATLEKKIYAAAGSEFNIDSPVQLSRVLFDDLKFPTKGVKKTKQGFSTAADELEKFKNDHPIIKLIMEYREKAKLKSTYVDALPSLVSKRTGRLHTTVSQTVAATGRLSSSDPNLQNIPVRTEEGMKIRRAFIAPKGYSLLSADYSQIELRVIASLAKDEAMIRAFRSGDDIHKRTASEIHGVPFEKVTDEMRYAAKAINFGIIYGQGPYGLSQTAGISMADARAFIETYFAMHQPIQKYLESMKEHARQHGFVETLFGRRRYIPEINSTVPVVRAAAERIAINMPIQGTAADLMKFAMIDIDRDLQKKYKPDEVKMLLTVHDELVFEVRDDLVEDVAKWVDEMMENPRQLKLDVPIRVDTEVGKNWADMESIR